jgi:hypothetical protein
MANVRRMSISDPTPAGAFRGGCFCGAVRFELKEIFDAGYCHCSICRRFRGAPLVVWANAPARAFRITAGEPAGYASSERWVRYSCPACGAPSTAAIRTPRTTAPISFACARRASTIPRPCGPPPTSGAGAPSRTST